MLLSHVRTDRLGLESKGPVRMVKGRRITPLALLSGKPDINQCCRSAPALHVLLRDSLPGM